MFPSLARLLRRRASGRQWWYLFAFSTAMPALILGVLALRAVRVVRLETDRAAAEERSQSARLASSTLLRELSRLTADRNAIPFEALRNGLIVFPRDRLFFGDFGLEPQGARPQLSSGTLELVEQARAAGSGGQAQYLRIAATEPRLGHWAQFTIARLREDRERLRSPHWSVSEGITPSGLPLPLFTAETLSDRALADAALTNLRAGRWWLSYEERSFHDSELARLVDSSVDKRLAELSLCASVLRRLSPRLWAGERYVFAHQSGAGMLVSTSPNDPERGHIVPAHRIGPLLDGPLRASFGASASHFALVDAVTRQAVWTGGASAHAAGTLSLPELPGLLLAFSGSAAEQSLRAQETLWYSFVAVLSVSLLCGLWMTVQVIRHEVELTRRQTDFVSAVTHEFKSPITSMRLLIERFTGAGVPDADEAALCYTAMDRETARLDGLVTRLLESQKIHAGKKTYEFSACSPAAVARAAADRFLAQAAARDIAIRTNIEDPRLSIVADEAALSEAVDNLLDNAIRYSGPGTTIGIAVNTSGPDVCLEVSDNGIGIDEDDLPRIFERFYRGRRGDRYNVRGTGLGLALVKAAAEAHGGRAEVESRPGAGSTFRIRIPIHRSQYG